MVVVFAMFLVIPLQSMQASSAMDTRAASQYSKVSIVYSVMSIMIGVLIQLIILVWGLFNLLVLISSILAHSARSMTCPCPYDDTGCCYS